MMDDDDDYGNYDRGSAGIDVDYNDGIYTLM